MASLPRAVPSDTLPVPRTSLVGRAAELARARHLLLDGAAPLVTLTGPGGVGKTRLALAIAHDVAAAFADGAVFVDLAPLRDPALVLPAIAQAVGVREEGDRPLPALLASYLRPRQLLLVLDNVEHVLLSVSQVAGLLAGCPALQVLATSRAPLRIRGEHLFVVPPLTLPDPDRPPPLEELAHVEALALFAQRAHAVDATFAFTEANAPSVTEVCRRLDGLPLAIELAAARMRALSPAALLALLSDRLRVLTGGERDLPERQRTLGAAIAWSYDLLTPPEQALFRRLSVFVGGFDVDAAAAVLGAEPGEVVDLLLALADQSLLRRVPDPENRPRFGMLETVREFASQALHERGEADGARRAHSVHYRDLAERCEAALYGPEMRRWLDRFALEHPNNLAALDYFVERGESTNELRLAAMLSEHWFFRGNLREGVARLAGAVARGQSAPPGPLAKALSELSLLCHVTGDAGRAVEFSARSVPLSRAAGDANRLTQSLSIHAISLGESGQHEPEIVSLLDEAVDWATNSTLPAPHLPNVLGDIGESLIRRGERSRGVAVIEEAIGRNLLIGNNWSAGMQLATLGRLELEAGNAERAAGRFGEALRLIWNAGVEMQVGFPVSSIAVLAMERGLAERAAGLVGAVEGIMERTGAVPEIHSSAFERARRLGPLYLGDDAYANAAAAGRRRPLAEAVAEALEVAGVLATTAPAVVPPPAPAARASARSAQGRPDPGMRFGLSPREREVLAMLVARQSDKDISEQLFISPRTVMTHATNIFTKLGVANRREAAAVAVRHALV